MGAPDREPRRRRMAAAAGAALALHAALLALVVPRPGAGTAAGEPPAGEALREDGYELAAIALIDEAPPGPLREAVLGEADEVGQGATHPYPNAPTDAPGVRAAAAGGGAPGADAVTGRTDRDTRSAQIWNDDARIRAARVDTGRRAASDEAITRDPDRGFEHMRSRPGRARTGDPAPQAGVDDGGQVAALAPPERDWLDADPLFDAPERRARAASGAPQAGHRRPLVERGAPAVDAHRRGIPGDRADSAARSAERDPGAYERTRASGGGGQGAGAGAPGQRPGTSPRRGGTGTAATRAPAAPGAADRSVRARRQTPYFRDMYRSVDRELRFPRERALALDQGEVVVTFTLTGTGELRDLRVTRSSGFDDFDREAERAFRAAAPFGAPPASLVRGARELRVRAPYKFSNPMIR